MFDELFKVGVTSSNFFTFSFTTRRLRARGAHMISLLSASPSLQLVVSYI
jgi:hypothetical protein